MQADICASAIPKPVVIVGAGGHAKVLLDTLRKRGRAIHGLCDAEPERAQARFRQENIIGDDAAALALPPDEFVIVVGVGSVRSPMARTRLFNLYRKHGFQFATVIHPSAIIADNVEIGEGAQILAGSVIQPGATIGVNAAINMGSLIDHDSHIGDQTFVAPGARISGGVKVGAECHIGVGATVLEYRCIGHRATIGAGAVVTKDVAADTVVIGIPAREFKRDENG